MPEMCINVLKTFCILLCVGMLGLGVLFFISARPVSFTPLPKTKHAQDLISLRQNYCLGNLASLGTGLVRARVRSEPQYLTPKGRLSAGWLRASASGQYELSLTNASGRIFVNNQQIFSRSAVSSKPATIQIELLTNRFYAIRVETLGSKDSTLPLQWRRPDGRREPVPKAYLYAPVATAGDGDNTTSDSID